MCCRSRVGLLPKKSGATLGWAQWQWPLTQVSSENRLMLQHVGWTGGLAPFLLGCFWGWGGGVGCQRSCYADDVTLIIWGWGGVGWDVNVHVTLMMLR